MHPKLQKQFFKFHENIRLDFEDGSKLREKRDLLIAELKAFFKKLSAETNEPLITFDYFNQGSYGLGIGIKPLSDEDHDIDVALVFNFSQKGVSPMWIKQLIHDALNIGNRTVEYLKPCVRVQYHKDGSESFHVDFASYSDAAFNTDDEFYLARGVPNKLDTQYWEKSDPRALINQFRNLFSGEDHRQLVRIIRGMKRWKDENFSADDNVRPIGIGITACTMRWFRPVRELISDVKTEYNDCKALRNLVQSMLSNFQEYPSCDNASITVYRLVVKLSIPPGNDLFEKMTDAGMEVFRKNLLRLQSSLDNAMSETNLKKACEFLKKEFGEDFPIPEENEEAKKVNEVFVSGGLQLSSMTTGFSTGVKNRGGFYGKAGKN